MALSLLRFLLRVGGKVFVGAFECKVAGSRSMFSRLLFVQQQQSEDAVALMERYTAVAKRVHEVRHNSRKEGGEGDVGIASIAVRCVTPAHTWLSLACW